MDKNSLVFLCEPSVLVRIYCNHREGGGNFETMAWQFENGYTPRRL
jgi:hypothetical protein